MFTRRLTVLLTLGFFTAQFASGLSGDASNLWSVAADGAGTVWAVINRDGAKLVTWQKNGWTRVKTVALLPPGQSYLPETVSSLANGSVIAFWRGRHGQFAFTQHRGASSSLLAREVTLPDYPEDAVLDGQGRLWVAAGRAVYRVDSTDHATTVARWTDDDYDPLKLASGSDRITYRTPTLYVDLAGQVWAWGAAWPPFPNVTSLKGVYRLKEDSAEALPITGAPRKPLTVFQPKDLNTVWLGVFGKGLYELDLSTGHAHAIAEPKPGAFRYVQQVTKAGNTWFVVADSEVPKRGYEATDATLWRVKGATWEPVLKGLDSFTAHRPVVRIGNAVWVGGQGGGVWRVLDHGKPQHADWRTGSPLVTASVIQPVGGSDILATGRAGGASWASAACGTAKEWFTRLPVSSNIVAFDTRCKATPDPSGRIWVIRKKSSDHLSFWDGHTWQDTPIPDGIGPRETVYLSVDNLSRVWVWERPIHPKDDAYYEAPVAIFDPSSSQWKTYPTWLSALESQRQKVRLFYSVSPYFPVPRFSKDDRIVFRGYDGHTVHYFDGTMWQVIRKNQFPGRCRVEKAFFDGKGRVVVQAWRRVENRGSTLVYLVKNGPNWEDTTGEKAPFTPFEAKRAAIRAKTNIPKRFFQSWQPDCVTEDAYGITWFWYLDHGRLMKTGALGTAPQTKPGETNPLRACNEVWSALLDKAGAAFLEVQQYNRYAIVTPANPFKTHISVTHAGADAVDVKLEAGQGKASLYFWKLNDGAWNTLRKTDTIHLDHLMGGEYTVRAACVDARLQIETPPAQTHFTIALDPVQQVKAWIAQLSSEDYDAREVAVKALSQRPDISLPALRAARAKASSDLQWWIDATIQRIGQGHDDKNSAN